MTIRLAPVTGPRPNRGQAPAQRDQHGVKGKGLTIRLAHWSNLFALFDHYVGRLVKTIRCLTIGLAPVTGRHQPGWVQPANTGTV